MMDARVLIVEDETVVAADLASTLKQIGYAVPAIVTSGEKALHTATEMQPDLVLMDIRLKGAMDGVEAAHQIRTRLDIPVVYLTAFADEVTLQRAKVTEPFGYILKPFQPPDLHRTIEMALYKHATEKNCGKAKRGIALSWKTRPSWSAAFFRMAI